MELDQYQKKFPPPSAQLNKFLHNKEQLQLQCTYIPPFAIIHQNKYTFQIGELLDLLQNIQNYNQFQHNQVTLCDKTFYITLHDEKKCILKDGEDTALIILPSNNVITIGIIDQFTKFRKSALHSLYLFDKLKNDNYKSLFS